MERRKKYQRVNTKKGRRIEITLDDTARLKIGKQIVIQSEDIFDLSKLFESKIKSNVPIGRKLSNQKKKNQGVGVKKISGVVTAVNADHILVVVPPKYTIHANSGIKLFSAKQHAAVKGKITKNNFKDSTPPNLRDTTGGGAWKPPFNMK